MGQILSNLCKFLRPKVTTEIPRDDHQTNHLNIPFNDTDEKQSETHCIDIYDHHAEPTSGSNTVETIERHYNNLDVPITPHVVVDLKSGNEEDATTKTNKKIKELVIDDGDPYFHPVIRISALLVEIACVHSFAIIKMGQICSYLRKFLCPKAKTITITPRDDHQANDLTIPFKNTYEKQLESHYIDIYDHHIHGEPISGSSTVETIESHYNNLDVLITPHIVVDLKNGDEEDATTTKKKRSKNRKKKNKNGKKLVIDHGDKQVIPEIVLEKNVTNTVISRLPSVPKEIVRKIGLYTSAQRILLVGEGDFSFSSCLAVAFGTSHNITATSLNSEGTLL
ncbi:hypothetical protein BVRB_4g091680 [Beta vulgaris subsp. vulgaris]|nr:hypothetical protein BVRB_4g091680 [Beta vulgaris subsp. vulgaris]